MLSGNFYFNIPFNDFQVLLFAAYRLIHKKGNEHTSVSQLLLTFLLLFAYYGPTVNIEVVIASYLCDGVVLLASQSNESEGESYLLAYEDFQPTNRRADLKPYSIIDTSAKC